MFGLLAVAAVVLAACGSDHNSSKSSAGDSEQAFLQGMVPHHESAVEMAAIAKQRATHAETRRLAGDISDGRLMGGGAIPCRKACSESPAEDLLLL